ncbi:GPI inositol-deacylase, variant 2 [Trebouxia sp. C0009 RCD-2024]
MGGLVAKAAAIALAEEGSGDSILAIVTLAAPQQQAPASVHAPLHAFYHKLQRAAQVSDSLAVAADISTNSSIGLPPLLSIAGGAKDLLVLPELNALVGVWPQHLAVEADVRDMPGVWVSADHQAMVWCNQLVKPLAQLLRSIAQPAKVTNGSTQAAHQHIVHLMQAMTQPGVTSLLKWERFQNQSESGVTVPREPGHTAGQKCELRKFAAGSTAAAGHVLDVIRASDAKHCQKSGCWWQWELADMGHNSHWTLLIQGARPCDGFQVMRTSIDAVHTVDITHTAVQLPDAMQQSSHMKVHEGPETTGGQQLWLVHVATPGVTRLWLDGGGSSNHVEATAEVSSDDTLTADSWQLLTHGHVLKPPHAIALRLALPYRAWLSALGMQLVAHSTGTGKVIASSSTLHHSSSSNSSRQYKNLTTASGEVTPGLNRQASKHQCWQPVLIAYGSEDSGQESMSSGREVVRTGPAAMSLWAIESHGKHIGVLSDPSCYVQLRLKWQVHMAAANALRLHLAALPALAAALLLLRLALTVLQWQRHSRSPASKTQYHCFTQRHHMQKGSTSDPNEPNWRWVLGSTLVWAVAASGLWPQLALGAGWMSHRRPTLPSVTGSAFLILVAEGLLEAVELICNLVRAAVTMLVSTATQCLLGRSGLASWKGPKTDVKSHDLGTREAISALCLIVAAPAEAMIHPMFPLLQSLVCHTWCAYQRNQGQQIVQPAAGRQSKAEGSTHHLQSAQFVVLEQQQQPSEWQQLPAGQQAEQGVAVPQLTPCISLHTLDLRDSVAEDTSELKTQQRQSEQDTKPQLSRHARSSLKGFSPEHRLKVSSMRAAALEQLLDQTLLTEQSTMRLPWCFTSAASANAQATHLKLLLCVVVLAALPFVAWLKQPRHMREWTCTQDALPAAVVAMHAPMLCLLGRGRLVHHGSLDQGMQCSDLRLRGHTMHAAVLFLAAAYSAGAALHDQQFRAVHSIAVASTFDFVLLVWAYHCHKMSFLCLLVDASVISRT